MKKEDEDGSRKTRQADKEGKRERKTPEGDEKVRLEKTEGK